MTYSAGRGPGGDRTRAVHPGPALPPGPPRSRGPVSPPAPAPVHPPARPGPAAPPRPRRQLPTELLVVFGSAIIAGITMLWNIPAAPDTVGDEVSYVVAARNVAQDLQLTWGNSPIFVHPPLSFLAQASWLQVMGAASGPVPDSIVVARLFAAGTLVFAILLIGLLTAFLSPKAGRSRGLLLVAAVVILLSIDPIMLRYGRMALIEPFALFASMLTLCLAVWLRDRRPAVYIPVVGLTTGLALLTKEMSIFLVATPVVYAILERDRRQVVKTASAVAAGAGLWAFAFMLWPIQLGLWGQFADIKLLLFKRLLGIVKTTGWNRPGFGFSTFLSEVWAKSADYASSYLLLAGGGIALLWLLLHRGGQPYRWLLAWLLTSYAFGVYMVAFGTLNEHLFVWLLPAAITGVVLVADAAISRRVAALRVRGRSPARTLLTVAVPVALLVALLEVSTVSWARSYLPDGDGVIRSAAYLQSSRPPCETVNAIASSAAWGPLMPGRVVTEFGTAEAALSRGVHLFYLNEKDGRLGYALPELSASVKARGMRVEHFPSRTYEGVELWEVPTDPYDALADVNPIKDGTFVVTVGSRCGGFPVVDGPTGAFSSGWESLGGKALLGPPLSKAWTAGGRTTQVFRGIVLDSDGRTVTPLPIVAGAAAARPDLWARALLPPVTARPVGDVSRLVVDPAIRTAYFGTAAANPGPDVIAAARARYGDPLGPATTMPDNMLRQPFGNVVFERPAAAGPARAAALGRLALDAGVVAPPDGATTPDLPPPLVRDEGRTEPTTVVPFLAALSLGVAVWGIVSLLAYGYGYLGRAARAKRAQPNGRPGGFGR